MSISPQWKEVEKMLLHFGADTGLSGACWPKWRRESLSPWKINPPRKYFCFRFGWWSSNFSWNISKYIKIYLALSCHQDFSFLRLNFSFIDTTNYFPPKMKYKKVWEFRPHQVMGSSPAATRPLTLGEKRQQIICPKKYKYCLANQK